MRWKYEKMAAAAANLINNQPVLKDEEKLGEYILFLFDKVFQSGLIEGKKDGRAPLIPVQDLTHIPEILEAVIKRGNPTN